MPEIIFRERLRACLAPFTCHLARHFYEEAFLKKSGCGRMGGKVVLNRNTVNYVQCHLMRASCRGKCSRRMLVGMSGTNSQSQPQKTPILYNCLVVVVRLPSPLPLHPFRSAHKAVLFFVSVAIPMEISLHRSDYCPTAAVPILSSSSPQLQAP